MCAAACTSADDIAARDTSVPTATAPEVATTTTTTTTSLTISTTSTTTTTVPVYTLIGSVVTSSGQPLGGATVISDGALASSVEDGSFVLWGVAAGPLTVSRPAWVQQSIAWANPQEPITIVLEPFVVRGLRVSGDAAGDPEAFATLLDMAVASPVNTLVFDTKAESGRVLYATNVIEAHDIGAVAEAYDPAELITQADAHDLYTITRIVTFDDPIRSEARRESKLAGTWMDPADPANWEYPLELAVEACGLGFDEVQFDYVRYPAGRTARAASARTPATPDERVAVIEAFLAEARARLHPLGCALSADVFAIVLSAENDQGIGQRPEDLSAVIDAISPMIYPSHYSDGWLGLPDPNDHPATVVGGALDDGSDRLAPTTLMRPWLQAFGYTPDQILAEIEQAEQRNHGWMLWNVFSDYDPAALPPNGPLAN